MSDSERTSDPAALKGEGAPNGNGDSNGGATILHLPLRHRRRGNGDGDGEEPRRQVRIRKLRVLALLAGLGVLAAVSTVFGMMMAVASDLPQMEDPLRGNSVILDANGDEIGLLTGNQRQLFVSEAQIAPVMKQAIIAIEDRRFYTNEGYDLRGIGRALWQDVVNQRVVQGGSTITQQFVKNALAAQNDRTLFVKLREAALAYQLTRKWSKERILRNYLNTIYFGNGAYGIESAAQTYFGGDHQGCEAGQGAPVRGPARAPRGGAAGRHGRLARAASTRSRTPPRPASAATSCSTACSSRGSSPRPSTTQAVAESLPTRADISPPREDTKYPYFTSWVKQQVVDKLGGGQLGARRAFTGGLTVKTTLDSKVQEAATTAIRNWLPVRVRPARVDGGDREQDRQGARDGRRRRLREVLVQPRHPGPAPARLLVQAVRARRGAAPGHLARLHVDLEEEGLHPQGRREVRRSTTTTTATRASRRWRTRRRTPTTPSTRSSASSSGRARSPRWRAGSAIRTPVSRNAANALGGLKQGVTPLDMAHAYETFAQRGELTYGSLSPGRPARPQGHADPRPGRASRRSAAAPRATSSRSRSAAASCRTASARGACSRPGVADQVGSILQTVVKSGTATRAFVPGVTVAGKTGTTEGYGDAWFVGWTKEYTVAIWVGYPDKFKPMETEFQGDPVAGGTYPAGHLQDVRRGARGHEEGQEGHDRDRARRAAGHLDRRRRPTPRRRPTRAARSRAAARRRPRRRCRSRRRPRSPSSRRSRRRPSRRPSARSSRRSSPPSRRPTRAGPQPAPGTG